MRSLLFGPIVCREIFLLSMPCVSITFLASMARLKAFLMAMFCADFSVMFRLAGGGVA